MLLIPNLLGGVRQSTLIVSRFLMQLRNARQNQITDFVNNKLQPLKKVCSVPDYTAYDVVRTGFDRPVQVEDMNDFQDVINDGRKAVKAQLSKDLGENEETKRYGYGGLI